MKKFALVAAVCLFAISGSAMAGTLTHQGVGLSIDIPDDWTTEADGDVLSASPKSEDLALMLWGITDAANLEKALEELGTELDKVIKDSKPTGDPEEGKINGLDAIMMEGTGTVDGTKIEFGLVLVHNGAGKFLIVIGFGTPDATKKYDEQLGKILQSVKKA